MKFKALFGAVSAAALLATAPNAFAQAHSAMGHDTVTVGGGNLGGLEHHALCGEMRGEPSDNPFREQRATARQGEGGGDAGIGQHGKARGDLIRR